ncbi:MAG: virulence RhuM family protein [Bacteroidales bacterium]|nr:virulence RhuM family protein [Bacteroidales bacterium]
MDGTTQIYSTLISTQIISDGTVGRKIGISDFSTKPMYLDNLDAFLKMTRKDILKHSGTISHKQALEKAHTEYQKFKELRRDEVSEVEKHFLEQLNIAEEKLNVNKKKN